MLNSCHAHILIISKPLCYMSMMRKSCMILHALARRFWRTPPSGSWPPHAVPLSRWWNTAGLTTSASSCQASACPLTPSRWARVCESYVPFTSLDISMHETFCSLLSCIASFIVKIKLSRQAAGCQLTKDLISCMCFSQVCSNALAACGNCTCHSG